MPLRLSDLTYKDLSKHLAFSAVGAHVDEIDAELEPVKMDSSSRIPSSLGEVWCLCSARFADGTEHPACAMCRGDSGDGPMLWTVWNGDVDVPLFVPPAPSAVLVKRGPKVFARKFRKRVAQVFPIIIVAVPHFAFKPEIRHVRLGAEGII